jgi:hypothetical protein
MYFKIPTNHGYIFFMDSIVKIQKSTWTQVQGMFTSEGEGRKEGRGRKGICGEGLIHFYLGFISLNKKTK